MSLLIEDNMRLAGYNFITVLLILYLYVRVEPEYNNGQIPTTTEDLK